MFFVFFFIAESQFEPSVFSCKNKQFYSWSQPKWVVIYYNILLCVVHDSFSRDRVGGGEFDFNVADWPGV